MKQLSVIIAVAFLLSACQPGKPNIPKYNKYDSFTVIYTSGGQRNAATGKIDSIYCTPTFKYPDRSLEAYWKLDTGWAINVRTDTMRDAKKKPIYDSASKSYKFNTTWYKLTKQDRQSIKVQIIY